MQLAVVNTAKNSRFSLENFRLGMPPDSLAIVSSFSP
jgi:hypothetical protein